MPPGGSTPVFEEVPAIPEQRKEVPETGASFETPSSASEKPAEPLPVVPTEPTVASKAVATPKDPAVQAVESILEEDLADTFKKMTPELQVKFRKEGERVTTLIVAMVRNAKVNARVVLQLISSWLKLIPGVNRFFLTQEAKIKTDKILKL